MLLIHLNTWIGIYCSLWPQLENSADIEILKLTNNSGDLLNMGIYVNIGGKK